MWGYTIGSFETPGHLDSKFRYTIPLWRASGALVGSRSRVGEATRPAVRADPGAAAGSRSDGYDGDAARGAAGVAGAAAIASC